MARLMAFALLCHFALLGNCCLRADTISIALKAVELYQKYLAGESLEAKIDAQILAEIAAAQEALGMAEHFRNDGAQKSQYLALAILSSARTRDYFRRTAQISGKHKVEWSSEFTWDTFEWNQTLYPDFNVSHLARLMIDEQATKQNLLYSVILSEFILHQCKKELGVAYKVKDLENLHRRALDLFASSYCLAYADAEQKESLRAKLAKHFPEVQKVDHWIEYHGKRAKSLVDGGMFAPGWFLTGDYNRVNESMYRTSLELLDMLGKMELGER